MPHGPVYCRMYHAIHRRTSHALDVYVHHHTQSSSWRCRGQYRAAIVALLMALVFVSYSCNIMPVVLVNGFKRAAEPSHKQSSTNLDLLHDGGQKNRAVWDFVITGLNQQRSSFRCQCSARRLGRIHSNVPHCFVL